MVELKKPKSEKKSSEVKYEEPAYPYWTRLDICEDYILDRLGLDPQKVAMGQKFALTGTGHVDGCSVEKITEKGKPNTRFRITLQLENMDINLEKSDKGRQAVANYMNKLEAKPGGVTE